MQDQQATEAEVAFYQTENKKTPVSTHCSVLNHKVTVHLISGDNRNPWRFDAIVTQEDVTLLFKAVREALEDPEDPVSA